MRKTKLTRFAALFLSAAMMLTALPATAAVPENGTVTEQNVTNVVRPTTAATDKLSDAVATSAPADGIATSAPTEAVATAAPIATTEPTDQLSGTPTAEATVSSAMAAMARESIPENGYGTAGFGTKPPEANGIQLNDIFDIGGNAFIEREYPNVAVVAQDAGYQAGYMWSKEKLNLNQAFETEMYMYLSKKYRNSPTGGIADGMTFVLHNDARGNQALGNAGEGIGAYTINGSNKGIKNSVIVEFDTYQNVSDTPFSQNKEGHVAAFMFQDGRLPSPADHTTAGVTTFPLRSVHSPDPALQNEWIKFTAAWKPDGNGNGSLNIHFGNDGDPAANVYDKEFQVNNYLDYFGSNEVYWGFTGATGGSTAIHAAAVTKLPDQELAADKKVLLDGKEISGGQVSVGDIITYQLTSSVFDEADPETIAPVIMEDELPAGVEYVPGSAKQWNASDSAPVSVTPTINGNKLTFATGVSLVRANSFVTVTFNVKVTDAAYAKTLKNTAWIYSDKTIDKKAPTNPVEVSVNADYTVQYYYEDRWGSFQYYNWEDEVVAGIPVGTTATTFPAKHEGYYELDTTKTSPSFLVTADKTNNIWKVYYKLARHTVVFETDGNGTLSHYEDEVAHGNMISLPDITPNPGYDFDHWTVDGYDGEFDYIRFSDFPITKDIVVKAHFRRRTPPIIRETGRSETKWTNQDVTVDYTVQAANQEDWLNIVLEDDQEAPNFHIDLFYDGQLLFTQNGEVIIKAGSGNDKMLTFAIDDPSSPYVFADPFPIKVTNIDKVAPTITGKLAANSNVTASDVKTKIQFSDDLSGINDKTRTLYLYQKPGAGGYNLTQTILFDDLDTAFPDIPGGQYYYMVSVEDNATNYADSRGTTGELDGPIYINAGIPVINPSLTFDDGTPYNEGAWTNKDVTVKYAVDGKGSPLVSVDENGTNKITTPNLTFNGVYKVTKEGVHNNTIDAENEAGRKADTSKFTIKIDKTKPIVDMPTGGEKVVDKLTNTKFTDEPNGSGIKEGSDIVKVVDKKTGKTVLEGTKKDVLDKITNGDLPDGDYTIEVTVEDNAGNKSDPRKEDVYHLNGASSASSISVTYEPDHSWTKGDVVATYTVKSTLAIQKVLVDGVEVTLDANNQGKLTFTANSTVPKVITVVTSAGTSDPQNVSVTWIDREAPTVTNLPTGDANKIITAANIKNDVTFADPDSPNASLASASSSGIDDTTKTVKFYQNGVLKKTSTWDSLEADMAALPAGKYTYSVSVEDKAGNLGESSEKPEVIINAATPTITTKLTMPDGSVYNEGTWVNKDVKVAYAVDGKGLDLKTVTVDGAEKLTSSAPDFKNSFVQSTTGEKTYKFETVNMAGLSATASAAVWVDKIAPVVEVPKSNTDFAEAAFKVSDADSGIDSSKTTVKAVPYVNGRLDVSKAEIINASASGWSKKLTEGVIYQLTLTGVDNAGNSTSQTVDKIQYSSNPGAIKNNKDVDLWGVKLDGGKYKISVDSKTYPIERLTISIGGGAEQVIPTTVGANYVEFIQSMPVNQKATIKVKLVGGAQLTGIFNPLDLAGAKFAGCNYKSSNHPKPAAEKNLVPVNDSIKTASGSTMTGTNFKNAVAEGFTLNGTGTTVIKPTVQYMGRLNGTTAAYKLYPNPTLLFTAARTRAYDVILVVTIPGEGTFYVRGFSTSSKIAPLNNDAGYIIQG